MGLRSTAEFQPVFAQRKILVTGGTGFIGNALVNCLQQLGADVYSLSLQRRHPTANNINVDWEDEQLLGAALAPHQFDMVFNTGGYLNPFRDTKYECKIVGNHFFGIRNLVQSLQWDRLQLFFHLGSGEEYGLTAAPHQESAACQPVSAYGLAKLLGTQYCQMRRINSRLPMVIGRTYLVYGRGVSSGLCYHTVSQALRNDTIPLSPGLQQRDFVHIDDLTHAICRIAQGYLAGQITDHALLNISSGVGTTVKEFCELVCQISQSGSPQFGALPYRVGENMIAYGSPTLMQSALQWAPSIALRDGIRDTINYMRGTL